MTNFSASEVVPIKYSGEYAFLFALTQLRALSKESVRSRVEGK